MSGRGQRGESAPLLVFALLSLVVAALVAGIVLTRGGGEGAAPAAAPTGTPPEADHQLTDAEAIARFKRIDAVRVRALEDRNPELLVNFFSNDSPVAARVRRTIRDLKKNGVHVDERWQLQRVEVVENTSRWIELTVYGTADPRFFDDKGADVTRQAARERRKLSCRMTLLEAQWLLHECTIISARSATRR